MASKALRSGLLPRPAFLLVVALTGCSSGLPDTSRTAAQVCADQEDEQFEQLETMVDDLMADEQFTTSQQRNCESTGKPYAVLAVTSPQWSVRADAYRFLEEKGWRTHSSESDAMTDSDTHYEASAVGNTEPDGTRFTTLEFRIT